MNLVEELHYHAPEQYESIGRILKEHGAKGD